MNITILTGIVFAITAVLGIAAISANTIMSYILAGGALAGIGLVAALVISPDVQYRFKEQRAPSLLIISTCILAALIGGIGVLHGIS